MKILHNILKPKCRTNIIRNTIPKIKRKINVTLNSYSYSAIAYSSIFIVSFYLFIYLFLKKHDSYVLKLISL